MKKMRKIFALLIAMVMVLGMSTSVFAATYDTATVTITGIADADTVYLYKIADAEVGEDNVVKYENVNLFETSYTIDSLGDITSDNYTDKSATGSDAKTAADTLAAAAVATGATAAYTKTGAEAAAGFDVDAGYYVAIVKGTNAEVLYQNMLINTTPTVNDNNSYDPTPANFAVKKSTVDITKTAEDIDESQVTTSDGYKKGDYIPFTITTNIPNYPSNSTYATVVIKDTPTGLTIQNSDTYPVVVKVDGTEVAPGANTYSLDVTDAGMTITFVKDYVLANVQKSIVVTYTAQLTAPVVKDGSAENKATLTYNPNPYDETTNEIDPVVHFDTYGFVFEKTDENNEPLENAVFALYDEAGTNPITDENGDELTFTTKTENNKTYVYFSGLAAGTYTVKETAAPAGFVTVADFKVTVNSEVATEDNPATADVTEENYLVIEEAVVNESGVELPSTGGIGTTLFYIIGAVLVIGSGVVLVTHRRMNA